MKIDITLAQLLDPQSQTLLAVDLPKTWRQQLPAMLEIQTAKNQPTVSCDSLIWYQGLKKYRILDYFNQAYDHLPINGQLIIMDSLQAAHYDYVLAQAGRCGFKLCYEHKQADGFILSLQKYKQLRWRTQFVEQPQQQAIRTLFKQVFHAEMDQAFWQWKYGAGRGVATGVWHKDELVAHYGGMYKRLSYFGKTEMGIQIGDVMVIPKERARLTRQGPFYLSATSFAEQFVGYGTDALVPYGFPSERHVKIAQRLGIYQTVDEIVELQWQATEAAVAGTVQTWQQKPRWQRRLAYSYLWRQMLAEQQQHIIGIRDWAYLQHRYCQHPNKHYDLLWFSMGRLPQALLIVHRGADMCRLMDYIGAKKYIRPALAALSHYLAQQNITVFSGWFSRYAADNLLDSHAQAHKTEIVLPTITWSKGPAVSTLKGRWWLSTGDTDFL